MTETEYAGKTNLIQNNETSAKLFVNNIFDKILRKEHKAENSPTSNILERKDDIDESIIKVHNNEMDLREEMQLTGNIKWSNSIIDQSSKNDKETVRQFISGILDPTSTKENEFINENRDKNFQLKEDKTNHKKEIIENYKENINNINNSDNMNKTENSTEKIVKQDDNEKYTPNDPIEIERKKNEHINTISNHNITQQNEDESYLTNKKQSFNIDEKQQTIKSMQSHIQNSKQNFEHNQTVLEKQNGMSANENKNNSKEDYKDQLKKLEDSLNDHDNNNYDFDLDDIITKEKEVSEKRNDINKDFDKTNSDKLKENQFKNDIQLFTNLEVKEENNKNNNNLFNSKKTEVDKSTKILMKKITIKENTNKRSSEKKDNLANERNENNKEYEYQNKKLESIEKALTKSPKDKNNKKAFFNIKMGPQGTLGSSKIPSPEKTIRDQTEYLYKNNKQPRDKLVKETKGNIAFNLPLPNSNKSQIEQIKKKNMMSNRNHTAKTHVQVKSCSTRDKLNLMTPNEATEKRGYSTRKFNKKYEEQKRNFMKLMNDPKNPYSTFWSNKILGKTYNVGIGINGFLNGVPVIKLVKKKESELPLLSKKLNSLLESDNFQNKPEFNTNRKHFFKARKDIEEDPFAENRESLDNSRDIEFPIILNYLRK